MLLLSCKSFSRPLKLFAQWNRLTISSVNRVNVNRHVINTKFVYYNAERFYCEKKASTPSTSIFNTINTNKSTSESSSSSENKEETEPSTNPALVSKWYGIGLVCMLGIFAAFAVTEWGPPEYDENGKAKPDKYSSKPVVIAYLMRTKDALVQWNKIMKEPSRELLLPDPLQPPYYQPPYTILIELNGLLTHPDWSYKTGWRFKKRPFVDYFIQACGHPNAELIIFTKDTFFVAEPIIDSLDRQGLITYRLYRDSTHYEKGVRIKDLHKINRPLSKVIHIDYDGEACKLNPNNCLILPKWEGNDDDKSLVDLANFIKAIVIQDVPDVRDVLANYRKFDDPLAAFKERQRQLAESEGQIKEAVVRKRPLFGSSFTKPKIN